MGVRSRGERAHSTVEWIGILFLVAGLLGGALAAAGDRIPGGAVARAIAGRIACAVRLSGACGKDSQNALSAAYGGEVAALVAEHAPRIRYERGMRALPVDYRRCREDACSTGAPRRGVALEHRRAGGRVRPRRRLPSARGAAHRARWRQLFRRPGRKPLPPIWFYYTGSATAEAV